jgi:hypothetical protein
MQGAFDAVLVPCGFQRTRKMLWVQRHAHTASFVFLQRESAGRASIDTSLAPGRARLYDAALRAADTSRAEPGSTMRPCALLMPAGQSPALRCCLARC